jgi:Zn-dependent protease with chaperone function
MALQGNWFDGKTSASRPVLMDVDATGTVSVTDQQRQTVILQTSFADLRVTSQVGKTPRYVYFPTGEKLETADHAQLDQWLREHQPSLLSGVLHQLESHSYFVLLAVVLVSAFTYSMVVYGLPAATRYVAFQVPASIMDRTASETLEFLDKLYLEPSVLDDKVQARLQQHFAPALAQNTDLKLKVEFRSGGPLGANAFALPDGTMVFTDEIVYLSRNDNELLAVLAHEIGHVKYRHSLRAAIQGSVISFGVAMLTGDLSAASDMLATLPTLVATMSYSRNFEREADDNSLVFLDANNIPRHHFVDLMERLSYQAECRHLLGMDGLSKKWRRQSTSSSSETGVESSSDNQASADSPEKGEEQADNELQKAGDLENKDLENDAVQKIAKADFLEREYSEEWIQQHKSQCDKLMASREDGFFDDKLTGYFASHPATAERTAKFKAAPAEH